MDDYVECSECGHPVESHDTKGCHATYPICLCPTRWTVKAIQAARREAGLPGKFRREDY